MKKVLTFLMVITLMAFNAPKKTRIIFFGDSITEYGIVKGGYIDKIQESLNAGEKAGNYELIGAGVSGNKIYDLYLRIDEDVIARKPAVVVIFEGVNDVWHKTFGTGTDMDKYEKFYTAVIKKLLAKKIRLVLVTPACIGEKKDNGNTMDEQLNNYCDVIRKLAGVYNCTLLDLRKTVLQYESGNNTDNKEKGLLTTDGVHLSNAGNQMLAEEMYKVLVR